MAPLSCMVPATSTSPVTGSTMSTLSLQPAVKVAITKSELKIEDLVLDQVGPIQGVPANVLGEALKTLGKGCLEAVEDFLAEKIKEALQEAIEKALHDSRLGKFMACKNGVPTRLLGSSPPACRRAYRQ